jgi:hypothetical protein
MDEMAEKLRSLIEGALKDVWEGVTSDDPPTFPEVGQVQRTDDGLSVELGEAAYRIRIERA